MFLNIYCITYIFNCFSIAASYDNRMFHRNIYVQIKFMVKIK